MRPTVKTTPEQEAWIKRNRRRKTVNEMAVAKGLAVETVQNFLHRKKLDYKKKGRKSGIPKVAVRFLDDPEPERGRIQRPPAVYTNDTPFGIAKRY